MNEKNKELIEIFNNIDPLKHKICELIFTECKKINVSDKAIVTITIGLLTQLMAEFVSKLGINRNKIMDDSIEFIKKSFEKFKVLNDKEESK
jgi:hypothetical protein